MAARYPLHTAAMVRARAYFRARGYDVERVQEREEHRGYDLIARNENEALTICAKASRRRSHLPDLTRAEVTENREIVADFLLVVSSHLKNVPILVIPRSAITPDHLIRHAEGFHVSATLSDRKTLSPFLRRL